MPAESTVLLKAGPSEPFRWVSLQASRCWTSLQNSRHPKRLQHAHVQTCLPLLCCLQIFTFQKQRKISLKSDSKVNTPWFPVKFVWLPWQHCYKKKVILFHYFTLGMGGILLVLCHFLDPRWHCRQTSNSYLQCCNIRLYFRIEVTTTIVVHSNHRVFFFSHTG